MELVKDFWRCGIVAADVRSIARAGTLDHALIRWIPNRSGLHYLADPFGLWHGDQLYVFVESFSYRTGIGHIELVVLDADLTIVDQQVVLREPCTFPTPLCSRPRGKHGCCQRRMNLVDCGSIARPTFRLAGNGRDRSCSIMCRSTRRLFAMTAFDGCSTRLPIRLPGG